MEIIYFDELDSTQSFLVKKIKNEKVCKKVAVVAKKQTKGLGSRGNIWSSNEGDLTFSFAIGKNYLPDDLPISSASIYFGYLIKDVLKKIDKNCWLKWPNDIYIKDKKCGGVITQFVNGCYVVGIGINLTPQYDNRFSFVRENGYKFILDRYFLVLNKAPKWKLVFSKFSVEFNKGFSEFTFHYRGKKISFEDAVLCEDGSLVINNERIYSLR